MGRTGTFALACAAFAASPVLAQFQPIMQAATATPEVSDAGATVAASAIIEGTPVEFEFAEGVSSKSAKAGQRFGIRLVAPILAGGVLAVPVGATGDGEVIHSARAGAAGKAGELILSARFIDFEGRRVPLRGFKFSESGVSRIQQAGTVNAAIAGASVFVPLPPVALLIGGKDVVVAPLTRGVAKVASNVAWSLPDNHQH
jgi:hypothetical protein